MPPKPMLRSNVYDDISTPEGVVDVLFPYLDKDWTIYEPCPGEGMLVGYLVDAGYAVKSYRFMTKAPTFDAIVTNPPFSKKAEFLKMCVDSGGPWALLLPVTTLGVKRCQQYLSEAEVIFLPKRVDFTGKKAPWFAVAWFTQGLGIGKQLNFLGK